MTSPTTCPQCGAGLRPGFASPGNQAGMFLECSRSRWHDRFRYGADVETHPAPNKTVVAGAYFRERSWGQRHWRSGVGKTTGVPWTGRVYRWWLVRQAKKEANRG